MGKVRSMRHALTLLCLVFLALPARAGNVCENVEQGDFAQAIQAAQAARDPLLEAYARWAALRDPKAPTPIDFNDGYTFLTKHPGWPDEKLIRLRTEEAALDSEVDRTILQHFCTAFPPISGRGMFACARGGIGTSIQRREWITQGWHQGDFSEYEETLILDGFGKQFTQADHIKRIDRLLFEEKTKPARRMLPLVPRDRETLYLARIALATDARDANARLNSVPVNLRRDPGLMFARIAWRAQRKDEAGVRELLLNGPSNPPYANLWWKYRSIAVREALADKHYNNAVKMLADRGELKGEALADALFLKGWIALSYLMDTHSAYRDFYALYNAVTTPVSKARAAYWAAEAARLNGNEDIYKQWLAKAAERPLNFYGQLAFMRLKPNTPLPIPAAPGIAKADETAFEKDEQVQLIRILAKEGQKEMADRFLVNLAQQAQIPGRFALLAKLAREVGDEAGGVRIAKHALRKGVELIDEGWPLRALPKDIPIEPALALAIIRQESEFDTQAESPAGAKGLMQLLPATAREVARDHGIVFTKRDLANADANIALGTRYLDDMIAARGGSYVLGIAAYNAGPGNVANWRVALGEPSGSPQDIVHWIENIPFSETRNYIMRVLENLQIYRQLLTPDAYPRLTEDLTRPRYSVPETQDGPT